MGTLMLRCLVTGFIEYTFIASGLSTAVSPFNEARQGLVLKVSKEKVSWYTAIKSGHVLINKDFVSKHSGWESIIQYIPEDEKFWIAARATHTPFVSWEGCARWAGDSGCEYSLFPGGAIGDCIRNCSMDDHFFMLEGTECRCVSGQNKDACFRQSTDRCDEACPNNPNDWCGGQTTSMALYYTGPFGRHIAADEKMNESGIKCVAYMHNRRAANVADRLRLQVTDCNSQIRRYNCGSRHNSTIVDNRAFLTWLEALSVCNRSKQHLYYKVPDRHNYRNLHWTSIRRSFVLKWTDETDEHFPFCVSLSRDSKPRLYLYEDVCEQRRRYLVYQYGLSTAASPHNESGQGVVLNISEDKVSWYTAIQSGHGLINEDFILKHGGWEFIIPYIPENEKFWIAARAAHTPFVSWEGCARWTGGPGCEYRNMSGGSIGDCIRNCSTDDHFLILQGTDCRCVSGQNKDACFRQSTDRCDEACPNNPNDWCGGQTTSMALYYTGPFGINITVNKNDSDNEMNCVLFGGDKITNKNGFGLRISHCNDHVRRYICGGRHNSASVDNKGVLTWLEALSLCNRSNQHLYYKLRDEMHWTSISRSFVLNWTHERDKRFPFCVSVSRDNASRLFLYEDMCDRNHSYLVFQYGDVDTATWLSRNYFVIVAAVLLVCLPPIAGLLYRCIITRLKKTPVTNDRGPNLTHQSSSVRLNPRPGTAYSENRGYTFMGLREVERSCDRARDFRRGTVNEVPSNVYHTTDDAANHYVNNRVVGQENSENFNYDDAAIGRALNENSSGINDPLYNACGAYMPVMDQTTQF